MKSLNKWRKTMIGTPTDSILTMAISAFAILFLLALIFMIIRDNRKEEETQ